MRPDRLAAALAAASLFAAAPGFGGTGRDEPWAWAFPPPCTPEAQRCLEKLEARLLLHGRSDRAQIAGALLEMHITDPQCAALLSSTIWLGP